MLFAIPLTVTWTVAGVHIAIGCAAGFAVILGFLQRQWPLRRTSADRAWLAWAAACLLAALFAIPEARSWQPMKKVLLIPVAHLVAFAFAVGWRARWALRLLVGATALTALLSMLLFWTQEHEPQARLSAWSHYITFAGQILLVLPAATCAAFATRGSLRGLYASAALVLLAALVLTFTRGAWLGLVAAFLVVLMRARPRLLWLSPVVVALCLLVAPETYRERAVSSFDWSHPQNQERRTLWKAGIEIWRDHPWTGVGLGDLIPVLREYLPRGDNPHGHLHSNVVQVLASRGLVGVVAFVWLQIEFALLLWRTRSRDAETAALLQGILGSFWGFQLMGLFEWSFGDVEIMIPLYFLLGSVASLRMAQQGTGGTLSSAGLFQGQAAQGNPTQLPEGNHEEDS